ncbi:MAG TPA: hypothetical protein VGS18_01750 [Thermoplasmata archaeon]|nr:hypothetical protein [Thermoplasmata archaeon]
MAVASRAPRPVFAKSRANPTLETIEYIRTALQNSEEPVSRNQLLGQLAEWGHSTTRQSLNAALAFLGADGNVAEGRKGIFWVPPASPEIREILRTGPRL